MNNNLKITTEIAQVMVSICFDVAEFSRLHEQDHPESAQHLFQCHTPIKKGLTWFRGAETTPELHHSIEMYLQAVDTALLVYRNLALPFKNKEELIAQLVQLQLHLKQLKKQVR